jgi:transposase-like protein
MKRRPLPQGLYCPNPDCRLFGQVEKRRLERKGYHGSQRIAEYRCQHCGRCFSETTGTFFYRLRTPRAKVLDALAMVAEQGGIRATARATGIDKDTIQQWVERAGQHAAEVSAYLIRQRHLSEAQLDELWTFVKKRRSNSVKKTIRKRSGTFSSGAA